MSSPLVPLPPSELLQSRAGEVIGASVPLLILPTVAVTLRLLSRWMSRAGFWWDDLIIVLACFLCWGPSIVNLVSLHYGFGRHLEVLGEAALFHWFKILYSFEFLYTLAMASVKYSIILFQYRIFPVVQFRRILLWANHFVVCLTIVCVLVSVFQCVPVHDFWDTLAGTLRPTSGGRCIDVELYFLIAGAINAATDFVLLALPIPILWRLRTSQAQKLVLTGIFTMGLTVCAVSVIRLIMLHQYGKRADITWYYVAPAIWTAAEPSIAVVSACLPSLRPLFVRVVWGGTHRPKPPTYPSTTSRYGSASLRKSPYGDGSFNRLQESDRPGSHHGSSPWTNHNVNVYGGRRPGDADSDEFELEGGNNEARFETPMNRIRAKTTVVLTISERVEFQDDLF